MVHLFENALLSRIFLSAVSIGALLIFANTGGVAALLNTSYRLGRLARRLLAWQGSDIEPLVPKAYRESQRRRGWYKRDKRHRTRRFDAQEEEVNFECTEPYLDLLGCKLNEKPRWCKKNDDEFGEAKGNLYAGMLIAGDEHSRRTLSTPSLGTRTWMTKMQEALAGMTDAISETAEGNGSSFPQDWNSNYNNFELKHRVAMCFVGDVAAFAANRLVHISLLENLVRPTAAMSKVDTFFNIYNVPKRNPKHQNIPSLCQILAKFDPVSVHLIRRPSCYGNMSATEELKCCNPLKLQKTAKGWFGSYGHPFDVKKHAAGLMEYYHIRQCYREVHAYEERLNIRYNMIVRVRPDLVALKAPLVSFAALNGISSSSMYFDVIANAQSFSRGKAGSKAKGGLLQDHFFVIPRPVARRFFEKLLVQSIERFSSAPWGTTKISPILLAAETFPTQRVAESNLAPAKMVAEGNFSESNFFVAKPQYEDWSDTNPTLSFSEAIEPPQELDLSFLSSSATLGLRRKLLGSYPSGSHEELDGLVPNCLTGPIRRNAAHGLSVWLRDEEKQNYAKRQRIKSQLRNGLYRTRVVYLPHVQELRWGMFIPASKIDHFFSNGHASAQELFRLKAWEEFP